MYTKLTEENMYKAVECLKTLQALSQNPKYRIVSQKPTNVLSYYEISQAGEFFRPTALLKYIDKIQDALVLSIPSQEGD